MLGAILIFSPETDAAVRGLWQAQADAGLPSPMLEVKEPPHMTLFMAEGGDFSGLRAALAALAREMPPLPVDFFSLGVFPAKYGVVFLAPVTNRRLVDLHAAIWSAAHSFLEKPYAQYAPGVWVPHVTLTIDLPPEQIGAAAAFLSGCAWPANGFASGILFGEFLMPGENRQETVYFAGEEN